MNKIILIFSNKFLMDLKQEFNKWQFKVVLPFESERLCTIVYNSLRIDIEPRPHEISRELSINGNVLQWYVNFITKL